MSQITPCSKLIKIPVTYFKNIYEEASLNMTIERVFKGIQSDHFKYQIQEARNYLQNGDQQKYNKIKNSLHAVTFCGTFASHRNANKCSQYNNLLVIDIDKLKNEDINYVEESLREDPYIAAFWRSPSGLGFKGLTHLHYDITFKDMDLSNKHKIAFRNLFKYLLGKYGIELDKSGSDISRLCFMSWDPYIVIKDEADAFEISTLNEEVSSNKVSTRNHTASNHEDLSWNDILGKSTDYTEHQNYRFKLNSIYKKLKKRNLSITETYEDWVKVAYAIASNLHPETGRKIFLQLCELDGINHDAKKSEKLIFDAYQKHNGKVGFGTIIYLAKQKGIELNS